MRKLVLSLKFTLWPGCDCTHVVLFFFFLLSSISICASALVTKLAGSLDTSGVQTNQLGVDPEGKVAPVKTKKVLLQ